MNVYSPVRTHTQSRTHAHTHAHTQVDECCTHQRGRVTVGEQVVEEHSQVSRSVLQYIKVTERTMVVQLKINV